MSIFSWFKKKDEKDIKIDSQVEQVLNEIERLEEAEDDVEEETAEEAEVSEEETEEEAYTLDDDVEEEEEEEEEEPEAEREESETYSESDEEDTKVEESEEEEETVEEKPVKKGFFARIKEGLSKTRENILSGLENVFKSFSKIDEEFYDELEEALIMADVGVETSGFIIESLRDYVKKNKLTDTEDVREAVENIISDILTRAEEPLELKSPTVILVIGVNGVGKTTTIGKLSYKYKNMGKSVLLAAADTFRAAAIDQLAVWAERNDVQIIKHEENSDPGSVVFDAVNAAKARNTDILICDTAGRLHNKKNLMDELKKISKIIESKYPEANVETLLVLDATTGQNALQQAKLFSEVANISGLVLTKLDGTAKGGIVIAIKHEMNIPVRYIGVGEGMEDLQDFDAESFAKALFGKN